MDRRTMLLYAVTDRAWVGRQTLYQQVESALKGGITCLQLREKNLDEDTFYEEAVEIGKLCRSYGVPFIVNDRVELAVRCRADGVHIGQKDGNPADVRRMIGKERILGVTAKTVEQALAAEQAGADYLGVGAMFSTSTKRDTYVISHDEVRRICRAVKIPVVAIGGISEDNILRLSGCGVDGAAMVSAVFAAEDIESQCRKLRKLSEQMIGAGLREA